MCELNLSLESFGDVEFQGCSLPLQRSLHSEYDRVLHSKACLDSGWSKELKWVSALNHSWYEASPFNVVPRCPLTSSNLSQVLKHGPLPVPD